jgi:hypothetical protein
LYFRSFAEKERTANSDDGEEVSSTSKSEQPSADAKESADVERSIDVLNEKKESEILRDKCDKNGATEIVINNDDDLVIVDS